MDHAVVSTTDGTLSLADKPKSSSITLIQWNILADGLAFDGFLPKTNGYTSIEGEYFETKEYMEKLQRAKLQDAEHKCYNGGMHAGGGRVSALRQFQESFQTKEAKELETQVLSWENRFPKMIQLIRSAEPDILAFQEMDHLKEFQEVLGQEGYCCSFLERYNENGDQNDCQNYAKYEPFEEDELTRTNYLEKLAQKRVAFAPKSYSNSRSIRKERCDNPSSSRNIGDIDDDGVAIFWKMDRFQLAELGFLQHPGSKRSEGTVAAVLYDARTNQHVNVFCTHLPSGKSSLKEIHRLNLLMGVQSLHRPDLKLKNTMDWVAISSQRISKTLDRDAIVEQNEGGIFGFIQNYRTKYPSALQIFGLDANSDPGMEMVFHNHRNTNVYHLCTDMLLGMRSLWSESIIIEDDKVYESKEGQRGKRVVSVNKMRGPLSKQESKIGEHAFELIDHVYTNGQSTIVNSLAASPSLGEMKGAKFECAPKMYDSQSDAIGDLIPNLAMPSDHYPIVVKIEWPGAS